MNKFSKAEVQSSGELQLTAGEQKLLTVANVTITSLPKGSAPPLSDGVLLLTTYRLAWLSSNRTRALALPLSALERHRSLEVASSLRGARAELRLSIGARFRLDFHGSRSSARRDQAASAVTAARAREQWVADERAAAQRAKQEEERKRNVEKHERSAEAAGVVGAVARLRMRGEARDAAIAQGFTSLDALRASAAALARLARDLQGAGGAGNAERNSLLDAMAAAGIAAPVTRGAVAGGASFYRGEIAREIATFLGKRLPDLGGLITVADAYCLVMRNRASAELVSPADFGAACTMLADMDAGIRPVTLPSGVRALQSRDTGAEGLAKMAEEKASIAAVDVVRLRGVPLARALDMLDGAEKDGLLARDEHSGVTRFFPNRFHAFFDHSMQGTVGKG